MLLRRILLALLGLWVALGVALAPTMPGMMSGVAPKPSQTAGAAMGGMLEHAGHGGAQHGTSRHHEAKTAKTPATNEPESEPSGHDHLARCVLCVVGAGTLALVVAVVRTSSPIHTHTPRPRLFAQPRRFRHFRSRAPPAVVSS